MVSDSFGRSRKICRMISPTRLAYRFPFSDASSRVSALAKPRPFSCTQTNTYTRGEQQVFRVWGSVAGSGDILSTENVKYAYVSVPGTPNMKMNWGSHGSATNKVWFWTSAWNLPADYPLGEATAKIVFKTEDDSFGTYEYKFTVVPQLTTTAKKTTTVKSR